jgi:hypothetical protein
MPATRPRRRRRQWVVAAIPHHLFPFLGYLAAHPTFFSRVPGRAPDFPPPCLALQGPYGRRLCCFITAPISSIRTPGR